MDLIGAAFPAWWQGAAWGLVLPFLIVAARRAPWWQLNVGGSVHAWCATIVCVVLLWTLRASVGPGLSFHLLGVSLFTLLVGPRLAFLGTAVVVAAVTFLRDGSWANYGIALWLMGIIPIAVTFSVLRLAEKRSALELPAYVFVAGFFGSAAAVITSASAASVASVVGAGRPLGIAGADFVPFLMYLGLGEAMVTAAIISALVVTRPDSVATFRFEPHRRDR